MSGIQIRRRGNQLGATGGVSGYFWKGLLKLKLISRGLCFERLKRCRISDEHAKHLGRFLYDHIIEMSSFCRIQYRGRHRKTWLVRQASIPTKSAR